MTQQLSPEHLKTHITGSGIALNVAQERGYYTATTPAQLEALDFAEYQRHMPALVLPVSDVHGQLALHQIRPDTPRKNKKRKPVKYDTPRGPPGPGCLPGAPAPPDTDRGAPAVVVEGLKKKMRS